MDVSKAMSFEIDGLGEVEFECSGTWTAGDPGVHTYSNGDPGYPGSGPEVEDIKVLDEHGVNWWDRLTEQQQDAVHEALALEGDEKNAEGPDYDPREDWDDSEDY